MRVTADGLEVYTDDGQPPVITLSVNSIEDPSKIQGVGTSTVKVIATKEAKRVLGSEFMADVERTSRPVLRIGDDDASLVTLTLAMRRRDRNEFECVGLGGNASWFDYAKGIVLKEYDWGIGPAVTYANILSSFDSSSLVYWPLIDFGAYEGEADTYDVALAQMRPGVRIGRIITQLFAEGGWTVVPMGVRANRDFLQWIHLESSDKALVKSNIATLGGLAMDIFDPLDPQYGYSEYGTEPQPLMFDNTPTTTGWNASTFQFTTQEAGNVYASFDFNIPYSDDTDFIGTTFRVVLWDLTDGVELSGAYAPQIDPDPPFWEAGSIAFQGTLPPAYVPEGHVIFIGISIDSDAVETVSMTNNNSGRLDFEVEYQAKGTVVLESVMPTGTLSSLVVDIAKAQSYVFNTRADDGTIEVWAREEFFRRPVGETRDWSDRMDHSVAPAKIQPKVPASIALQWIDDDSDRNLARLSRVTQGRFANARIPIARGYDADKEITMRWASTFMAYRFDGCMIPVIRNDDEDDGVDNYKHKPRLLYSDGLAAGEWTFNTFTQTNYPKCYFLLPGTDMVPVAFDNPTLFGGGQPVVKDVQWAHQLREMAFAMVLEAYLFIRDHELQEFDHGMPTLVDDGSGPAWYYVQEIQQHRFGVHQPTKCLLVEIPGKEVDMDDPVVRAVTYPTNPFVCAGPGYIPLVFGAADDGSLLLQTTSGYWSLRASIDGNIVTVASNDTISGIEAGGYCAWPSDAAGNFSGTVFDFGVGFDVTSVGLSGMEGYGPFYGFQYLEATDTAMDIPYVTGTPFIHVTGTPLEDFTIHASTRLSNVEITGAALTEASVVAIINAVYASVLAGVFTGAVDISGGTSAAPPSSLDAIIAALTGTGGPTVSGTGLVEADGEYDPNSTINGKNAYIHSVNGISEIFWTGSQWRILTTAGIYDSYDDVLEPWLCVTWIIVSGSGALPTIAPPGFGITVTTN